MRIAHVLTSFEIGGAERMARDLAAGQVARGHQAWVVSLAPAPDGPLADEFRARGVEAARIAKRPGVDPVLPLRLAWFFRRAGIQVVHAHNQLPLIYGAPAARLAGAAAVYTRHGRLADSRRVRLLRGVSARLLDAYVAVSRDALAVGQELGEARRGETAVIENGIDMSGLGGDPAARAEARRVLGLPEQAWVIGSVGRIVPDKNYELLVEAAAPLLGEAVRLVIIGGGPDEAGLRARAARLPQGPFIHLPGMRSDAARLLAAFDVFALSSRTEGLPLVLLEAMATGLPVVCTAVGGIPAVLGDAGAGLLSPPGDAAALRAALEELRSDPTRAQEMGRRGRSRALERYSQTRMVDEYLQLYQRAAAHRRG